NGRIAHSRKRRAVSRPRSVRLTFPAWNFQQYCAAHLAWHTHALTTELGDGPALLSSTCDVRQRDAMDPSPSISVVISTFNRCESLKLTLESLARQSVPDDLQFEVIVVDNNSSDETRGVVARAVAAGSTRLRYEFEPRAGVSY